MVEGSQVEAQPGESLGRGDRALFFHASFPMLGDVWVEG